MPAKAILHFVSLLILHLEFVMKRHVHLIFTSLAFHFSEILVFLLIFSISFATLTYMSPSTAGNSDCDVTRGLSCSAFYLPQLENASATFTSSNITRHNNHCCAFASIWLIKLKK